MPAIKAQNSRNITVESCSFFGFETDIELDNVDGFISKSNRFSQNNDPKSLLTGLSYEIENSMLDRSSKKRLVKEVIDFLSSKGIKKKEESIKNRLVITVGEKAADFFVQLCAAVAAGIILKFKMSF